MREKGVHITAITLDDMRSPSVLPGTNITGCPRGLCGEGRSDASKPLYATNHGFWALNTNYQGGDAKYSIAKQRSRRAIGHFQQ